MAQQPSGVGYAPVAGQKSHGWYYPSAAQQPSRAHGPVAAQQYPWGYHASASAQQQRQQQPQPQQRLPQAVPGAAGASGPLKADGQPFKPGRHTREFPGSAAEKTATRAQTVRELEELVAETPWLRDAAAKGIPVTNPDYIRAWTVTKNKFNGNIRNRKDD